MHKFDASVQPGDPGKLCGRRILNIIGGVLVGIGFNVGGPSFCKAGGTEEISDVGGFLALEGDSLVKMPRESFMCQCGKKLQALVAGSRIYVDHIGGSGIHRWGEIKAGLDILSWNRGLCGAQR